MTLIIIKSIYLVLLFFTRITFQKKKTTNEPLCPLPIVDPILDYSYQPSIQSITSTSPLNSHMSINFQESHFHVSLLDTSSSTEISTGQNS